MAKANPATYSKAVTDLMESIKSFLISMGVLDHAATTLFSMPDDSSKVVCSRLVSQRDSLEAELISSGGEEDVLLTEERRKVLTLQPLQLLQKLKDGNLTAVKVLEAFQAKAVEESKRTNCITSFIPEAKKWAENLDALRTAKTQDLNLMPLHGLPLSVKEIIMVEGMDSTLGLARRVDQPSDCDAALVAALKKLGAVPFVTTNVPQLCLSIGCSNPVYGETTNPHDTGRATGGSSGGEAALIGGGGSFLGIGTDIGGSVRCPAHFCGVASFKPTARRIPNAGIVDPTPGIVGVYGTLGIMGRDALIVAEAVKALLSMDLNQYDPDVPPVPWREALFTGSVKRPLRSVRKTLRIGWYDDNGLFETTPGVKRSIAESVVTLKNLGHELVPFQAPDMMEALKLWFDFIMADNGTNCSALLKGETVDQSAFFYKVISSVPANFKNIAKPYVKYQIGEFNSDLTTSIGTGTDMWKKMAERAGFAKMFVTAWKKEELDLLLCPVFPSPALLKGFPSKLTTCAAYTMVYNLLDFPCAVLPVTRETEEDQKQLENYPAKDCLHQLLKEHTEGSEGMPLGVQFVALPFCEEILCRILIEFSKAVKFSL